MSESINPRQSVADHGHVTPAPIARIGAVTSAATVTGTGASTGTGTISDPVTTLAADGATIVLHPGDALFADNPVQVAAGSEVTLLTSSGMTVIAGGNSRFLFGDGSSSPAAGSALTVLQGSLIVVPGASGGPAAIDTPAARLTATGATALSVHPGRGLDAALLAAAGGHHGALEVRTHAGVVSTDDPLRLVTTTNIELPPWSAALPCDDPLLDLARGHDLVTERCETPESDEAPQGHQTVGDMETSPGGDPDALTSDRLAVTAVVDAFDLRPQNVALSEPGDIDPDQYTANWASGRSHRYLASLEFGENSAAAPPPPPGRILSFEDFETDIRQWERLMPRAGEPDALYLRVEAYDEPRRDAIGMLPPLYVGRTGDHPFDPAHAVARDWRRDGASMALLSTGPLDATAADYTAANPASDIEGFLGLPLGALPADSDGSPAGDGVALRATVRLNAGDVLRFDYLFDAADELPDSDFAVFTVTDGHSRAYYPLATIRDWNVGDYGSTGWYTGRYTAQSSGTFTIGFAVVNDGPSTADSGDSRLLLDNVRILANAGQPGGEPFVTRPAPTAVPDVATTDDDVAIRLPLFANDINLDTASTAEIAAINGIAVTPGGEIVLPSGAVVSVRVGGAVIYDPHGAFAALALHASAIDGFTYTLADTAGNRDTASVTVTVTNGNSAPVAVADAFSVAADQRITSGSTGLPGLLANDRDLDRDALTVVGVDSSLIIGRVVARPDGQFTYDPRGQFAALAQGETAIDGFRYTITDGLANSAAAPVRITVIGVNDAPTARNDNVTASEDFPANLAVLANDDDIDSDDSSETLRLVAARALSGAPVRVTADGGSLVYDPTSVFNWLSRRDVGSDTVVYTMSDRHGAVAHASAVITIFGRNDAPIAVADRLDVDEDTLASLPTAQLLANDSDPDTGDRLSIAGIATDGISGGLSLVGDRLLFDPAGRYDWLAQGEWIEEQFRYTVSDGIARATAPVTLVVRGINDPVRAAADAFAVSEDDRVEIIAPGVLANDVDPDLSDKLRVVAASVGGLDIPVGSATILPSGALLTIRASGAVVFDPHGAYEYLGVGKFATEMLAYTVSDGHVTDTATATLTVIGANDRPVAGDDRATTAADASVRIDVLGNDHDVDIGDVLFVGGVDRTGVPGWLNVNANGTLTYDPEENFRALGGDEQATVRFRYQVSDGHADGQGTGEVAVTVNGVNDAPEAGHDELLIAADGVLALDAGGGLLANDVDPDAHDRPRIVAINGDAAAVGASLALVSGATLIVNADGSLQFDPGVAYRALARDETSAESFTYTVSDGTITDTARVRIMVSGVNDTPIAVPDAATVLENGPAITIDVLANDSDPDRGDAAGLRVISATAASGAAIHLSGLPGGGVIYDPAAVSARSPLAAGVRLDNADTISYVVRDRSGAEAAGTVAVSLLGRNDAPVAVDDLATAVARGAPVIIDALTNDRDPDGDETAGSLRIVLAHTASGASVVVDATGGAPLRYLPGSTTAFDHLGAGEHATDTITYWIEDSHGQRSTAPGRITVDIAGSNDPLIAIDDLLLAGEDLPEPAAVGVLANDLDQDDHDVIRVVAVGGDATAVGRTVVLPSGARLTMHADGIFVYDPAGRFEVLAGGEAATDGFDYTASDGLSSATAHVRVALTGSNDAPIAVDDIAAATQGGSALRIDVLANDYDIDSDGGLPGSLRLVAAAADSGATVVLGGAFGGGPAGTLLYNAAATHRFDALAEGETLADADRISYRIEDVHGLRASRPGVVHVSVTGVNDAPIASDDSLNTRADRMLSLSGALGILGNDSDPDHGDTLRVTAINGVAAAVGSAIRLGHGGLLTIAADGSLVYDPTGSAELQGLPEFATAVESFSYSVTDGHGVSASAAATITVLGHNLPPGANPDQVSTDAGLPLRLWPLANDTDPDAVATVRLVDVPATSAVGARLIVHADGSLTYDPRGAFSGLADGQQATDSFIYIIDDLAGQRSQATVSITVHGGGADAGNGETLLQSFEDPGLPMRAWGYVGQVDTGAALPGYTPTHRGTLAVISATGADRLGIERSLGLVNPLDVNAPPRSPLPLDPVDHSGSSSVGAAALKGSIAVSAADVVDGQLHLSFDWNFIASSAPDRFGVADNPFAFVSVSDGTIARVYTLTDARSSGLGAAGWRTSSLALDRVYSIGAAPLLLTLGFGVANDQSDLNPPSLLIDNIRLNREIGADYDPIGASGDGVLATARGRPVAADDAAVSGDEDSAITLHIAGLLANDRPSAGAGRETLAISGARATAGEVTIIGDQLILTPDDVLGEGESRLVRLDYTLTDGNRGSDSGSLDVRIIGHNDAPVTGSDVITVGADAPLVIDAATLVVNDQDADASDTITLRSVEAETTLGGAYLDGDMLIYDPQGRFAALGEGEVAHDRFEYVVDDGRVEARGSVAVVITGRNDPIAATADAFTVAEDRPITLAAPALFANDSDPDANDRPRLLAINGGAIVAGTTLRLPSGALLAIDDDGRTTYDPNGVFAFLAPGETRADQFSYTVGDGHGSSDTAMVSVTVVGANQGPSAADDDAITDQDAAVRIAVLSNDSDPDVSDRLHVVGLLTSGTIGGVRINADGTVTYATIGNFDYLRAGESATDSFRYLVADQTGAISTASVSVTIGGIDRPQTQPQELLQSFETRPLPNPVWGYLGDVGTTDRLLAATASGPTLYTPTHRGTLAMISASGADRLGIERSLGLVNPLDVNAPPRSPLPLDPVDHSGSSAVGAAALKGTIAVSAADVVDGQLHLSFDWNFIGNSAPDRFGVADNPFAFVSVSDGTAARVYTLTDARSSGLGAAGWRTSSLALDRVYNIGAAPLLLTLGFGVANDQSDLSPPSLLIDNIRLNREIGADYDLIGASGDGVLATARGRPVAADDLGLPGAETSVAAPLAIPLALLLANDAPSSGVGRDSFQLIRFDDSDSGGRVSLDAANQVIYDPRGRFAGLAAGESTFDEFRYILGDGNGGTDAGSVRVRVTGLNDAPVAATDYAMITENRPAISLAVLINDNDVDSDDDETTLRLIAAHSALGAGITFAGGGGAELIYRPDGGAIEALAAGEKTTDTVSYTIIDRHGATADGIALVTLTGVNDAPVATADAVLIDEDGATTIAATANDDDIDSDDSAASLRIVSATAAGGGGVAITADGAGIIYQATGRFDRLAAGETATDVVSYTITDRHGATASATATVSITGRNDAPIAGPDIIATTEGTAVTVAMAALLANDRDPEPGDAVSFAGLDLATSIGGVSFDGVSLTYDPAGRFEALSPGETATDHIGYIIRDPHGAIATGALTVRVAGVNDDPRTSSDSAVTDEDTVVRIDVLANDHDPDRNDRLTVIDVDDSSTRGGVGIDADGRIAYDPRGAFDDLRVGDVAIDQFTYTAADRHGATTQATVTVTVTGRSDIEKLVSSFEHSAAELDRTGADAIIASVYSETDGARGTYRPTEAAQMVRLDARGTPAQPVGADPVPPLERFLGLPAHSLPNDSDGSFPASGSAFRLYLTAHREDQISFDWMFDARDAAIAPADGNADNDFAVYTVVDTRTGAAELFKFADVRGTGDKGASGWLSSLYRVDHDADLMIGFAVVNDRATGPASDNSSLLVDNVRLNRPFDDSYQVIDSQQHGRFDTLMHHG